MNKIKFITIAVISTLSICINSTSAMNNIKKENHKNPKTNNLITTTNKNNKNQTKNNFNSNSINLNKINNKQINNKQNKDKSMIKENLKKLNDHIKKNNFNGNKKELTSLIQNKTTIIPTKYETNNNQNRSIDLNLKSTDINEQNKIEEDEKEIQNLNAINIDEQEEENEQKEIQNLNAINIYEQEVENPIFKYSRNINKIYKISNENYDEDDKDEIEFKENEQKEIQNLNTINIDEQEETNPKSKELIEPKEEDYDSDSSNTGKQNPIFKYINEINEKYKKSNKKYEEDEENEIEFNENEQSKIKEMDETIKEIIHCFGRMVTELYFIVQRDVCEDYIHMRNTTFQNPITQKYEHFCIAKNSEALFTNLIYSLIHNIVIPSENTENGLLFLHHNAYNDYLPDDDLSEVRLVNINVKYDKKLFNEDNLTEEKIKQFKKERINECREYIKKLIKKIKDHIYSSQDKIISKCICMPSYESDLYYQYFYRFSEKFDELKQAMEKFKEIIKMCYKDEKLKEQLNRKFKKYVKNQNDKQADGIGFLICTLIKNQLSLTDLKSKNLYIGKNSKYEMFHKGEIEKNNELLKKTSNVKQKGDDIIKKENKDITEKELIEYCDNYVKIGEYIRVLMDISIKNLSEENTYTIGNLDNMILEGIKNTFKNRKFEIPEEAFDI